MHSHVTSTPALSDAVSKPRAPIFFWDWNSNPIYLYLYGQVRSNELPFAIGQEASLRELTCAGRQNNTNANAFYALYKVTNPSSAPTLGVLPSVTNQTLLYTESDFPYSGTSRVSIQLVNNGASKPLVFSENVATKTVTIQLATNGSSVVTTTRSQLISAFELDTTISLIYAISGSGATTMTPATFSTSGGSVGNAIGSVFMRAKAWGFREGYNISLSPGDFLIGRVDRQELGSFSPSSLTAFISFKL